MAASPYYYQEPSHHRHGSSSTYSGPPPPQVIVEDQAPRSVYNENEYALVAAPTQHLHRRSVSSDRRHHHRHRHGSHSSRRSSRGSGDESVSEFRRQHRGRSHSADAFSESARRSEAAKAALAAVAIEAWRSRKEPGGLTGKTAIKRAATAGVASGAIDYYIAGRYNGSEGGHDSSKKNIAGSVIGGLLAQRVLQGKAHESDGHHHESSGKKGLGELVAMGAAALGGEKLLNHGSKKNRSRSGSRDEREDGDERRRHRGRRSSSSRRYYDD